MPLDGFPERPLVRQEFNPYALQVLTTPTPLNSDQALTSSYIDSFAISVPTAAANSVFLGGQAVTIASGFELVPGSLTQWAIDQGGRQPYELQRPLLKLASFATCKSEFADMIPFMFWDPAQISLIAAANTNIVVALFRSPFV